MKLIVVDWILSQAENDKDEPIKSGMTTAKFWIPHQVRDDNKSTIAVNPQIKL